MTSISSYYCRIPKHPKRAKRVMLTIHPAETTDQGWQVVRSAEYCLRTYIGQKNGTNLYGIHLRKNGCLRWESRRNIIEHTITMLCIIFFYVGRRILACPKVMKGSLVTLFGFIQPLYQIAMANMCVYIFSRTRGPSILPKSSSSITNPPTANFKFIQQL